MKYYLLLLFLFSGISAVIAQTPPVDRGAQETIDLLTGQVSGATFGWGSLDRDAHHATVAMNDLGDILVAFNSERDDLSGVPTIQQVEIAYFEFDPVGPGSADDTWVLISQQLVGSTFWSPLLGVYPQPKTSCLKSDVVADGNRFFVVWTRQYDKDFDPPGPPLEPQKNAPSILECAWINKVVACPHLPYS